jgi:hypothetical protein
MASMKYQHHTNTFTDEPPLDGHWIADKRLKIHIYVIQQFPRVKHLNNHKSNVKQIESDLLADNRQVSHFI